MRRYRPGPGPWPTVTEIYPQLDGRGGIEGFMVRTPLGDVFVADETGVCPEHGAPLFPIPELGRGGFACRFCLENTCETCERPLPLCECESEETMTEENEESTQQELYEAWLKQNPNSWRHLLGACPACRTPSVVKSDGWVVFHSTAEGHLCAVGGTYLEKGRS